MTQDPLIPAYSWLCPAIHGDAAKEHECYPLAYGDFFAKFQLEIPLFQRRYCWAAPIIEKLFQDIMTGANLHTGLGKVILFPQEKSPSKHKLLDGQQRTTTLLLLLKCLKEVLPPGDFNGLVPFSIEDRLKVSLNDTPCFTSIMTGDSGSSSNQCEGCRVHESYALLRRLIAATPANQRVLALERALQQRLVTFVVHTADPHGENHIFLWLSEKSRFAASMVYNRSPGETMAESDLIRNLLLSLYRGDEAQMEGYRSFWLPLEEKHRSPEDRDRFFKSSLEPLAKEIVGDRSEGLFKKTPTMPGCKPLLYDHFRHLLATALPTKGKCSSPNDVLSKLIHLLDTQAG
uniref:GmrSD restriction endonucleases N-terminal domain-containing protein n=1 Tax=Chromera velia CCMP2878 TaxID=1169474 RepID=A0A0G4G9K2_9ALVE|eukprot:Cvel_20854.t1-p1 / transcript=Cvel_20854.t1 / gene=Cvel_20854 / organism=Chromera_velia_CCMP2878 / gene_product=hypothetical protein / transcript_product=hypothetical protein / location=Cvel_scaffold1910:30203-31237(+) / protein_length=345 / sequence_SO=supercontig / SO=protein_coding / is_pseudo=false